MASLLSHILSSAALFSLGLYHLLLSTRAHLKSPTTYSARPFRFLPGCQPRLRYVPLYLLLLALLLAAAYHVFLSSLSDPLVHGRTPVHRLSSLRSSAILFLFLLLSLAILLSDSNPALLPLPHDLAFTLIAAALALLSTSSFSAAATQTSDLHAKCESVLASIAAVSAGFALTLACNPRLFVAEIALAGSLCLQGLWVLQTGLSLYVEAFIPDGCHRMLDVVSGVEGSTKCDLEDAKLRAVALLDLAFVFHVIFVVGLVVIAYAVTARAFGVRRTGSYEALPTSSSGDLNHVQMKALIGTQA